MTLAPEAGSQRLRDVVNKNVDEADLMSAAARFFDRGFNRIKLYFMLGLPSETDEDLEAIIDLAASLRKMGMSRLSGRRTQIVVSVSTTPDADEEFTRGVAEGLEYACRAHGVFILGGDTNAAPTTSLTACAVGLVPRERVLTRKGAAPGDAVFLSGHAGIGNALGLARLGGLPDDAFPESGYRPTAELAMGRLLRGFASSCMDTSDGVFATLDQMMRINGTGFVIDCNCSRMLDPNVLDFCKRTDTPQWLMAAGPHGEFKLLFTVSPEKVAGFMGAVTREGLAPLSLGTVQERRAVSVVTDAGTTVDVDVARLRNLLYDVEGDMERFVREFVEAGKEWGLK